MNFAVRRLLIIACVASALPLSAQTTKKTTASTPPPVTVSTSPSGAPADVPAADQAPTVTVSAATDQDVNNPRAMRLSLDDAIHTMLQKNIGVQIQRYDLQMSAEGILGAYNIFDPFAGATISKASTQKPALNAFSNSGGGSTDVNPFLRDVIPTGGSFEIATNNSRFTSSGNGTTISPGFSTDLGFVFTQPLARNFGVDITRRGITIARNNLGISREAFRGVLLDSTSAVEQAYYDLIYTRRFVDVVKEALFLARDQSRITQIRIDVGASAPLDILQPRVQIATGEENLITAVANVRSAEDRLRALLNVAPEDWDRPIIPTDNIGYTPMTVNVEESVARAYELRPEVKENAFVTGNRRVTYQFARNQVLPQFDLNVGYKASGAAGTFVNPSPGQNSTGFTQAVQQVFRNDFPGWNVGFTIGVPVFNFGARAEKNRARLDLQASQITEAQTRQNIAVDVRATARAIDTAAKQISATRTAREAAEENVNAERKRYENGMSTNFQVLQIQQQLSDARANELQALVGYNKAVAAYHRAVGDLLDTRNISVDEPKVEEPSIFSRFNRYNWLNFSSHDTAPEEK
ncbi:MAG TPA: TolC family protein [Thermoanaerobaculia bacterium]|jgi:HAE1 family hydrophobic/amphiphilic exporter-1|nr:TolC family protein [Thermoanaerobaculia bacterium]